jgi:hypothetical protein
MSHPGRFRPSAATALKRAPKPTFGKRWVTTPRNSIQTPAGRRSPKLISSPTAAGTLVSMKHPPSLMSEVRASYLPASPSHVTSKRAGTRGRRLRSPTTV